MKRFVLIASLTLGGLLSVGCSYDTNTIVAEVPSGSHMQKSEVPAGGRYSLYHVTEFDEWGAPTKTVVVKTVTLPEHAKIGFRYELPPGSDYQADARSNVVAFAGNMEPINLGPIETLNDHYYWASPDDWNGYWAMRPEIVLAKKATMY